MFWRLIATASPAAVNTHLYTGGAPPDAMVDTLAWLMCEQKSLCPFAAIAATVAILRESTYCSVGAKLRQRSWNTPGISLKPAVRARLGPLPAPLVVLAGAAAGPSKASRPPKLSSSRDMPPPPLPAPVDAGPARKQTWQYQLR